MPGFCLWVSVFTALLKAQQSHPLCPPALGLISETVQWERDCSLPKTLLQRKVQWYAANFKMGTLKAVNLWEPVREGT